MRVFLKKEFKCLSSKNHFIFICDHATNFIPKKYNNLGISKKYKNSHIAYDIGAKSICVELAKSLNQSYFLSNFSRLIIDPNRKKSDEDLIPSDSFGITIPGNKNISSKEKDFRFKYYYLHYHNNLAKFVKVKLKSYKKVLLVSVHSFTKSSINFDRGVEVGLLWNKKMNLLLEIQKKLQKRKIHYGRNFPYSGFHLNYTLDTLSKISEMDNISIEIRNDLICSKKGIKKYVNIFSNIFKDYLNE